jgi:hypothetical protein
MESDWPSRNNQIMEALGVRLNLSLENVLSGRPTIGIGENDNRRDSWKSQQSQHMAGGAINQAIRTNQGHLLILTSERFVSTVEI